MYYAEVTNSIDDAINSYDKSKYIRATIRLKPGIYDSANINSKDNILIYGNGIGEINKVNINNSKDINIRDITIKSLNIHNSADINIVNCVIQAEINILNSKVKYIRCKIHNSMNISLSFVDIINNTFDLSHNKLFINNNSLVNIYSADIKSVDAFSPIFIKDSSLYLNDSIYDTHSPNAFSIVKGKLYSKRLTFNTRKYLDVGIDKLVDIVDSVAEFHDLIVESRINICDVYSSDKVKIHSMYIINEDLWLLSNVSVNSLSTNIVYVYRDYKVEPTDHTIIAIAPVIIRLGNELNNGMILVIINSSSSDVKLVGNIDDKDSMMLQPYHSVILQYNGDSGIFHSITK